ncbi:MAG TPA: hypothetical protein VJK72_05040 [Candidatus Nanoarchaeia archaeon]|nr:hypothetical protein [Candidatus Nanoarchaeia archaeon]
MNQSMKAAMCAVQMSAFILDGPLRDISPQQTPILEEMTAALIAQLVSSSPLNGVVPVSSVSRNMPDYSQAAKDGQGHPRMYQS